MKYPNVLILGTNGMTGNSVYNYLTKSHDNIYGTSRKNNNFKLSIKTTEKDLKNILKKIKRIDFIVNCIGLNNVTLENKSDAIQINSLFPLQLSNLSKEFNFKLIHISTDAVFNKISGKNTEKNNPNPDDLYGMTKLLGEIEQKNTITVRTSLIGLSPFKKSGLVEFVLNNKNKTISGYINQKWSGATTLQLAKFIEMLIYDNYFDSLRKKSSNIHFTPLGPITKYDLIKSIIKINKINIKLKKTNSSVIITRYLESDFLSARFISQFENNTEPALKDLFSN